VTASRPAGLPPVIDEFLDAVEKRDPVAVAQCFTEDGAYWFAVPQPPVVGRETIQSVFARVLGEVDRVVWDVVTSAVDGDRVWLERLDRFSFRGREAAIECIGLFELDGDRIRVVRDYCDMSTWQTRRAAVSPD
jgi:limonene-1,2-epoxide hydrolase